MASRPCNRIARSTLSLELVVWHSSTALDASTARSIYEALVLGDGGLDDDPALDAFEAAIRSRYARIEVDRGKGFLYVHLPFDATDNVRKVRELALAHGLTLYDPQASAVYQPAGQHVLHGGRKLLAHGRSLVAARLSRSLHSEA